MKRKIYKNTVVGVELNHKLGLPLWFSVTLGIMLVATITLAVGAASKGARLAALDDQRRVLTQENESLTANMVSGASLKEVSVKAESLGMIKPVEVVYLVDAPVASLP